MKNLGLAGLLLVIFSIDMSAQSMAEIARRERERQKHVQSKKVFTNAGQAVSTAAGTAGTAPVPAAAAPAPFELRDNQGHNEKYWRDQFEKARADAKRADDKVILLEQKVRDLNTQLLRQSDMYNRENRLGPEIQAATAELESSRKEAAQTHQKITDLEDALRRAGGPAGWAR